MRRNQSEPGVDCVSLDSTMRRDPGQHYATYVLARFCHFSSYVQVNLDGHRLHHKRLRGGIVTVSQSIPY
jgi:hypothetical protein